MNRLAGAFEKSAREGRKILLPFLTGGYPDEETFLRLLFAVEESGADGVEVGIPFSDPSADGPTIQAASEKALKGGATVSSIMESVKKAREKGLAIPLLYMTYYNPVLAFGPERFAGEAARSGADGVLVVDLPREEWGEFMPFARDAGLVSIPLVAPTTPVERIPYLLDGALGFVYCVSVAGVTGVKRPAAETVAELVARVRKCTQMPALVGFGVSDADSAAALARVSDGVIVGSALLSAIGERRGEDAARAAKEFLAPIRAAI